MPFGQAPRALKFYLLQLLAFVLEPLRKWRLSAAQPSAGVLMYHRISAKSDQTKKLTWNVTPARMRRQLRELLQLGYEPWPLSRLVDAVAAGEHLPPRVFAVTFDDGYANFHKIAVPILKELNVPATIFLATKHIGSAEPFPFDDWEDKGASPETSDAWKPMTWDDARALSADPLIEIGSHTHTHGDFVGESEAFAADLQTSLDVLEYELGIRDPAFSFPYGAYDAELIEVARRSGVTCALNSDPRLSSPGGDCYRIGRFNVDEFETGGTLSLKLDGWFEWFRSMAGLRRPNGYIAVPPTVLSVAEQGVMSVGALVTNLLLAYVSAAELGVYYLAYSTLVFCLIIQREGVSTPYTIYANSSLARKSKSIAGSALMLQIVLSLSVMSLALGIATGFSIGHADWSVLPMLCVAGMAPFFLLRQFLRDFAYAHDQISIAVVVGAIATFIQLTTLIVLLITGHLTAVTACITVAASSAAAAAALGWRFRDEFKFRSRQFAIDWLRNFKFARWSLASNLTGAAGPFLVTWYAAAKLGANSAGTYATAATLAGLGQLFVAATVSVLLPRAARTFAVEGRKGLFALLRQRAMTLVLVLGSFAVVLSLSSDFIATDLLGWHLEDLSAVVIGLAVSVLASGLGSLCVIGLYALQKPYANLPADILMLTMLFLLTPPFVAMFGIAGAGLSMACAAVVGAATRFAILLRTDKGESQQLTETAAPISEHLHNVGRNA